MPVRDGDARARALYLRHYSHRSHAVAHPQGKFAGPGEHLMLLTVTCDALFLWRRERYRRDAQTGINCAIFRNEGAVLSSDLVREADDLAWRRWPGERLFTFVNADRIRSTNPGACFRKAGWRRLPESTKGGLVILERLPADWQGGP